MRPVRRRDLPQRAHGGRGQRHPEPDFPAIFRHHVLSDPTGRRRRRLAIAGRVATAALGLWLVVLILGGLGLQPLDGLPIVRKLGVRAAAPPALPKRVQAAVDRHTTVAPATGAAKAPMGIVPPPPRRAAVTPPSRAKTRLRTTPATPPVRPNTNTGVMPTSPAPAPSITTTSPSTTVPGQTRTPPGQTKTEPGPPTTTPGGTPGSTGKTHTSATVTTP
jgi:hypothetical protein